MLGIPFILAGFGALAFITMLVSFFRRKPLTVRPQAHHLKPGTLVDHRHQIMECVGEGGLGLVYGAQDTRLHRPVALKFVREEHRKDPAVEEQFFKEAIHASQVNHPNICTIFDYGHYQGHPFIVMEFLNGYVLEDFKLSPPNDWNTFRHLACQILDGLEHAHDSRLFHGDIKPSNIMVIPTKVPTEPLVKIFDFGLSRILRMEMKQIIDSDHTLLGSIHYMAPEQFLGDHVDGRTDLYSAGVMFYEMLSGKLPFDYSTAHELIEAIVRNHPIPLSQRNPEVPEYIEKVIMKLIARDPSQRYQTASVARLALGS